jgi:NitT/TauT family transport system permease protein
MTTIREPKVDTTRSIATAGGKPSRKKPGRLRSVGSALFYPVLAFVILIVLWEGIVGIFHPPVYVLPSFGSVMHALGSLVFVNPFAPNTMWSELGSTLEGTILAFVLGSVIGVVIGVLMGEFSVIRKLLMPYMVALQSLPKAALVPVIIAWIGYGIWSKVAIGFILAIFAVIVNTLQGVTAVDQNQVQLVRSLGAGRWRELRYVRWPAALPSIFVGLELAIVYSLLGIVVAEVLGAQSGIGVEITQLESVSDTEAIFALLIILSIVGFVLHWAVAFAHRKLAWWDRPAEARKIRRSKVTETSTTSTAV